MAQVLRGGVGLFNASRDVSRKEWHDYVQTLRIDQNYPGIQGMGVGVPVSHALFHIERLFGTRAPATAQDRLSALHPRGPSRWAMNTLLSIALRPDHPACNGALTGPARFLLYLRSHYLRMPWYQIVPHLLRKAWMRAQARPKPAADKTRAQAPV